MIDGYSRGNSHNKAVVGYGASTPKSANVYSPQEPFHVERRRAHTHTHTHTHHRARPLSLPHFSFSQAPGHTLTQTPSRTFIFKHTHTHTSTHKDIHSPMPIPTHTHTYTHMYSHRHLTLTHTHTHIHMVADTHMYLHTLRDPQCRVADETKQPRQKELPKGPPFGHAGACIRQSGSDPQMCRCGSGRLAEACIQVGYRLPWFVICRNSSSLSLPTHAP